MNYIKRNANCIDLDNSNIPKLVLRHTFSPVANDDLQSEINMGYFFWIKLLYQKRHKNLLTIWIFLGLNTYIFLYKLPFIALDCATAALNDVYFPIFVTSKSNLHCLLNQYCLLKVLLFRIIL